MKLYTLSIDNETVVANTNRKQFDNEVKQQLSNDLLSSIESLIGHEEPIEDLTIQYINLQKDKLDLLDLAHDMDYNFKIENI